MNKVLKSVCGAVCAAAMVAVVLFVPMKARAYGTVSGSVQSFTNGITGAGAAGVIVTNLPATQTNSAQVIPIEAGTGICLLPYGTALGPGTYGGGGLVTNIWTASPDGTNFATTGTYTNVFVTGPSNTVSSGALILTADQLRGVKAIRLDYWASTNLFTNMGAYFGYYH